MNHTLWKGNSYTHLDNRMFNQISKTSIFQAKEYMVGKQSVRIKSEGRRRSQDQIQVSDQEMIWSTVNQLKATPTHNQT